MKCRYSNTCTACHTPIFHREESVHLGERQESYSMANGCQLRDLKIASPAAALTPGRKYIALIGRLHKILTLNVNPVQHSIDVLDACQTIYSYYMGREQNTENLSLQNR
eukprot:4102868-Pleurochrysis_carterae.AAC.1